MKYPVKILFMFVVVALTCSTMKALTVDLCTLRNHPKHYSGQMIRIRGTTIYAVDGTALYDNHCLIPLKFLTPYDQGISVKFRANRDRSWYKFWYYNSFNTMSTAAAPRFYWITGAFYGLFKYSPPLAGNVPSKWVMVLASVSNLVVKPT